MSVNGTPPVVDERILLIVTFKQTGDDLETEIRAAGITRREAAQMLAKLAAELAQKAAREDEEEP